MIILGIETSCDETAASVVRGQSGKAEILSNVVSSQIEIHRKYGGVVPEVAAREHVFNILPVINEALEKAEVKIPLTPFPPKRPAFSRTGVKGGEKIDAIAVTVGPGLITSLLVGVETAKTLAYAWKLPLVAVNHIEGHIYANFIGQSRNDIKFPALILTVSGGHTMLVLMNGHGKYKILGETRDDAAGEAFDKAAKLMGIGYPGGPAVAAEAAKFSIFNFQFSNKSQTSIPKSQKNSKFKIQNSKISLPRPMINSGDFDFSFSGLKTALLYALEKDKNWKSKISAYAAEFQQAIVDSLVHKTIKAAKLLNCQTVMLSGGVAANAELRSQLKSAVENKLAGAKLVIPDLKYCTDNAAMIATAGYFKARRKDFTVFKKMKTEPNLELK